MNSTYLHKGFLVSTLLAAILLSAVVFLVRPAVSEAQSGFSYPAAPTNPCNPGSVGNTYAEQQAYFACYNEYRTQLETYNAARNAAYNAWQQSQTQSEYVPQTTNSAGGFNYPYPAPVMNCPASTVITTTGQAPTAEQLAQIECLRNYRDAYAAWDMGRDAAYDEYIKSLPPSPFVIGGSPVTPTPTPTPTSISTPTSTTCPTGTIKRTVSETVFCEPITSNSCPVGTSLTYITLGRPVHACSVTEPRNETERREQENCFANFQKAEQAWSDELNKLLRYDKVGTNQEGRMTLARVQSCTVTNSANQNSSGTADTNAVSALLALLTLLKSDNPPTRAQVEAIVASLSPTNANGSGTSVAITGATAAQGTAAANVTTATALLAQAKVIKANPSAGQTSALTLAEQYLKTANAQLTQGNVTQANATALAIIELLKKNFPELVTGIPAPITQTTPGQGQFVIGPSSPVAPAATITQNLSRGSTGPEVIALQTKLASLGYLEDESISGFFGPLTEAAVKKFQCDKNIVCVGTPSTTGYGMVGPSTRAALNGVATPTPTPTPTPAPAPAPACAYEGAVFGGSPQCTKAIEGSTQYGSRCTCSAPFVIGPTPAPTTLKLEVSNSVYGPWTENGAVCNDIGQKAYVRLSGVNKNNPPKGCADLTTGSACLNLANHRSFTETEWLSSGIIQTIVDGGLLQNGSFNSFISYPGGTATKAGSFQLKQCNTTTPAPTPTPAPAPACAYEGAVFGGSPQCTKAIEGSTQYGSRCTCKSASQIFVIGPSSEGSTQPKSSGVGIAYSEHIAKAGGYYTSMGGWIPVETSGWYDVTNNKWISFDGSPTPAGVQQMIDARGN